MTKGILTQADKQAPYVELTYQELLNQLHPEGVDEFDERWKEAGLPPLSPDTTIFADASNAEPGEDPAKIALFARFIATDKVALANVLWP